MNWCFRGWNSRSSKWLSKTPGQLCWRLSTRNDKVNTSTRTWWKAGSQSLAGSIVRSLLKSWDFQPQVSSRFSLIWVSTTQICTTQNSRLGVVVETWYRFPFFLLASISCGPRVQLGRKPSSQPPAATLFVKPPVQRLGDRCMSTETGPCRRFESKFPGLWGWLSEDSFPEYLRKAEVQRNGSGKKNHRS